MKSKTFTKGYTIFFATFSPSFTFLDLSLSLSLSFSFSFSFSPSLLSYEEQKCCEVIPPNISFTTINRICLLYERSNHTNPEGISKTKKKGKKKEKFEETCGRRTLEKRHLSSNSSLNLVDWERYWRSWKQWQKI